MSDMDAESGDEAGMHEDQGPSLTDLHDDILRMMFRKCEPVDLFRLYSVNRAFYRCLVTDPNEGSHGELRLKFSDENSRITMELPNPILTLVLPTAEPALPESLALLFGGPRMRRFSAIRVCGPDWRAPDRHPWIIKSLDMLRGGGWVGTLRFETLARPYHIQDMSSSDLLDLLERHRSRIPVVIDQYAVRCTDLLTPEGPMVSIEEEQGLLRLAGLPNLAITELQIPFLANLGSSFLAPLANLCEMLVVGSGIFADALNPLASLTNLRGLRLRCSLKSPDDFRILSYLSSLTFLGISFISRGHWQALSDSVRDLPLRDLSFTLMDNGNAPGPDSSLSTLGPLALPDSLTSLTLCARVPTNIKHLSLDVFERLSHLKSLVLRLSSSHHSRECTLRLGSSLGALTALQSSKIAMDDFKETTTLELPESFSLLMALTRFQTEGISGDLRIPAEPATWAPLMRRMEGSNLEYGPLVPTYDV